MQLGAIVCPVAPKYHRAGNADHEGCIFDCEAHVIRPKPLNEATRGCQWLRGGVGRVQNTTLQGRVQHCRRVSRKQLVAAHTNERTESVIVTTSGTYWHNVFFQRIDPYTS